ncbi:Syntaxin [Chondrus crispus]|uniref:Syntaxin n=1 Tax=Chondrus crispus TaxID=2769 RepID=R7Q2M4_CHOCR|nr:Syntaxin [Chondrus crispus]CDF32133.1 Syntaxin [Chondrus crispus]|eukprot:XP_005711798.1 Syntaxin [Chondrus crispus]
MRRRRAGPVLQPTTSSGTTSSSAWRMTLAAPTSVRNRTAEFATILDAARAASTPGNKPPPKVPSVHLAPRSEFTRLAAHVGKDIQGTSVKLAELTKLAQRRSLFNDPTAEISELTYVIKQDIAALNGKLADLQRLRDATKRSANKHAGDHSENVVDSLKGRLGATAEGFKKVLKMRTDSLAAQQDRRSHFMGANQPSAPMFTQPAGNVALDLGQGSLGAAASGSTGHAGTAGTTQHLSLMRRPGETTYQDARADAVRQVESTIVELGQIFNQLATMVSEQGELVERIDANVEETVTHMDAGQNQLMLYYNSIAGNRALILKVFGVLLAFLVLWTVIL